MDTVYCVFVLYTEDERNIVSELVAVTDSLVAAHNIITDLKERFPPTYVCHDSMTPENNFTYVGKRSEINSHGSKFRTFNGFVVEPIKLNEVSLSSNI